MTTVGTYEAKTRLPALIKRVEAGETITITNHGRPVARLVPIEESPRRPISELLDEMHVGRINLPAGESINDLVDQGRRF